MVTGTIMWGVTALSIFGVVLNTYKRKECFVVWIGTNSIWMGYDWHIGAHEQAAMMGVYMALSVWGLVKWWREAGMGEMRRMGRMKCDHVLKTGMSARTDAINGSERTKEKKRGA